MYALSVSMAAIQQKRHHDDSGAIHHKNLFKNHSFVLLNLFISFSKSTLLLLKYKISTPLMQSECRNYVKKRAMPDVDIARIWFTTYDSGLVSLCCVLFDDLVLNVARCLLIASEAVLIIAGAAGHGTKVGAVAVQIGHRNLRLDDLLAMAD